MPTRILIAAIIGLCMHTGAAAQAYIDLLPSRAEVIENFSYDSLYRDMECRPLHHIEGIWQFTADGITIAIDRHSPNQAPSSSAMTGYRMILISAPNRSLRPGTVIGLIAPTAKAGTYEARIHTSQKGLSVTGSGKFTLTLDDEESRIVFSRHKSAYSINLWRALPYMFRHVVRKNEKRESSEGCIRIFPQPARPHEPVYL